MWLSQLGRSRSAMTQVSLTNAVAEFKSTHPCFLSDRTREGLLPTSGWTCKKKEKTR